MAAYTRVLDTIRNDRNIIVASFNDADSHPSWFQLQDCFIHPETMDRIVRFDNNWYNYSQAWFRYENDTRNDFDTCHTINRLFLSLFEGLKFSPAYTLELFPSHLGVRIARSVRQLVMTVLFQYRVPDHEVERMLDIGVTAGDIETNWDASTIGTWDVDGDEGLDDDRSVVVLGDGFYDAIDLTFMD